MPRLNKLLLCKTDYKLLGKNDYLIILTGSNDINVNLTVNNEFAKQNDHTNVIIMNIPYRYDQGTVLPEGSINNMIHKCNKKLNEILQTFQHVKISESTYERTWYTKLGYHLNNRGKDMVSNQICKIIGHSVLSFIKPETPLPLQDKNFQFEEKKK